MYKKKLYLLLLVLGFLFSTTKICAKTYECHYTAEIEQNSFSTKERQGSFKVDTDKNEIDVTSLVTFGTNGYVFVGDTYINPDYTNEEIVETLDGNCPKRIYLCKAVNLAAAGSSGAGTDIVVIINGENHSKLTDNHNVNNFIINKKSEDCSPADVDESKSTAAAVNIDFPCNFYIDMHSSLENGNINSSEYISKKESLKTFCKAVLNAGDYILDPCVKPCLGLAEDLAAIEGIPAAKVGFCGFSDELIAWIRNIIKYIKYFLPVIVIVLGILDFIKAIASSNDDDMKKAQDKFVKRLISAAIVFLVPLIIGFIMDQFGFTPEYCGVFK